MERVLQTKTWLIGLVIFCGIIVNVNADSDDDICRIFSNGTWIRDPESCNKYIQCIDFKSNYYTCTGAKPFYDKDNNRCVASLSDESTCQISCTNYTGKFVSDPKSCEGYYYCQDEELALFGSCPDGTHFNTTQQACIYSFQSACSPSQFDYCNIIKNGVNFNDESSCEKYFNCKNGTLKSSSCTNQYYDAISGACIQKSLVNCAAHPYPTNVCGTKAKPLKNQFVNDGATCRGYFYCVSTDGPDPSPKWGQCPTNTFFSQSAQACVNPLDVKCEWDRCDGRTLKFVSSGTAGCRHYLRCTDGIRQSEDNCGNFFFDEEKSICISTQIVYPSCKV